MCDIQHFILTRFNLLLWQRDKEGAPVRTQSWLEHRFTLFESFSLPSLMRQTNQGFIWIVLFDSTTPEKYRQRIAGYKDICPQFEPVFVAPERGRFFANVFRDEMVKRLEASRIISTYLDNDDALNVRFVEDLRRRVVSLADGTFIRYSDGYQYYTKGQFVTRICYPKNHFVSVLERGNPTTLKGIYGYGGHFHIDENKTARIENIEGLPMWCEVVHEKNMINDANFFIGTRTVKDKDVLRRDFALEVPVDNTATVYVMKFLPRYAKTFVRRARNRLFGRKW